MRKLLSVGLLCVLLGGATVQAHPLPQSGGNPLVEGNNAFACELYHTIRGDQENIIVSPYSISSALAMLYVGARGGTQQQMADALHFSLSPVEVASAFYQLNHALPVGAPFRESDHLDETQLNIANALWILDDYPILPDYATTLDQYFDGGLQRLDFVNEPAAAREIINAWITDQTEGRFTNMLPAGSISPLTRLILTNAIYFRAAWPFPFDVEATQDDVFTLLDGSEVVVPMMEDVSFGGDYGAGDGYQVVRLPYRDVGSMVIILPAAGQFEAVEAMLDAEFLAAIMDSLEHYRIHVVLPRFEFDTRLTLSETLAKLGMVDIFTETADFSGIVDPTQINEPLLVSDVLHKAYIKVDEDGTEAVGITVLPMGGGGTKPRTAPDIFRADRPFIFLIIDDGQPHSSILFMGRVLNPAS